jgi:hypothetical protein
VIEAPDRPAATAAHSPRTVPDERAARRTLQRQIERLESDLAELFASAWPRTALAWSDGSSRSRGPRILGLGDLEQVRDELAHRVAARRRDLDERHAVEQANRRLIEDMLAHPERHPWVRVSNADIGEPGCHHWHVVPRFGLLGRLAGWWRVKISSGCPLAMAR